MLGEESEQLHPGVAGSTYYADLDHLYFLNRFEHD